MGIVRPVMEVYPYAWVFFVPFILVITFAVMNLFIAIIVESMTRVGEAEVEQLHGENVELHKDQEIILNEIKALRVEIAEMRKEQSGCRVD